MHIFIFLTIYCIYAYPPPLNMHYLYICCYQILIICERYLIICILYSFICGIKYSYCKGHPKDFPRGLGSGAPQIIISGRVKGRLRQQAVVTAAVPRRAGTMRQLACRVPYSHGALRVSALLLVLLASKVHMAANNLRPIS